MRYGFGDYTLDTQRYELCRAGQRVPLRPKVFQVLAYLLTHRDRVVSKEELLAHGWPGQCLSEETLTTCITAARQAVGDSGAQQAVIQTRRGYGYCFVATVAEDAAAPGTRAAVPPAPIQMEPLAGAVPVPAAERRQLTVLCCALVDATRRAGQLDPEDYHAVLQAYLETCTAVIARVGGTIDTVLGDRALVCFGYPQAHDDDPQRAVRAGLEIVAGLARVNTRLTQTWGVQLTVRIGIHTGLVVAGELGRGATRDPQAIVGEAPNIAARLQERAAPNTVVCSAATARLVEGYFTLEALSPQGLKGVTTPVSVYRVVGESGARTRFDVATARGLTPLVGREVEVALLHDRWAQVTEGLGQVVCISGEAGIGKSRLVQVLKAHVARKPHVRWECRGSPYYQHTAFYPLIDLWERALDFQRDEPPEAKLAKLERALAQYRLPLDETVPLLAALLSLPLPAERYRPLALTPQRQKQRTLDVLLGLVLERAEHQPVLVILEDLHWVDPSTLEFLTLLLDQGPTAAVLTLLTCRPEFQPPWGLRSHLTPLALHRLPPAQVRALIAGVTGGKALPPDVTREVVTKTDGVPLFVEELTKMVLEAGWLREQEGHYALTGPLPPLAIPPTLHDSLMARLDRLATVKEVAQLGATIGRTFDYTLLQAVSPLEDATLQHGLRQLVEAELVYQRGVPPQATYTFKHALIQDAAYQSLLRSTRQQSHQQIAQVLEAHFPETAETQPELLAHHYTEAGLHAQAIPYWQRAGQQALQRSANPEAVGHLTKGLELLATLPETPVRAQQELDLQLTLGPALGATKGTTAPEVAQTYVRARALCAQSGETPQLLVALRGLCRFYASRGALPTARELGAQLVRLAEHTADPMHRLVAHGMFGDLLFYLGDYAAARTHFEQGIVLTDPAAQLAQALSHGMAPGVECLGMAAHTLWCLGYPAQAVRRSQEALALAQALAHSLGLAHMQHWAAWLHQRRRDVSAVREQADVLLALATAQGFPVWAGSGIFWQGWIRAVLGQGEAGLAQMRQGLAAIWATRAELWRPFGLVMLAEAAGHVGQVAEGLRLLAEALKALEANAQGDMLAEAHRLQGELLLCQAVSDATQAEACFQQALAIARRQQAKSWELRAATSLARLWQRQGQRTAARELLAPVYSWFTEGFDTTDLQEAKALLEELG